jgi:medium-chain acyl-[acyl-carrier-protein] hydrolase
MKLFCVPYSGASSMIYGRWKQLFSSDITIIPLELPGRGRRFDNQLINDMEEMVLDLLPQITNNLKEGESYCVFGHSLGGLIVYELLNKIVEKSLRRPKHAFFSGINPPHRKKSELVLTKLPDDLFMEEIFKLGGTQKRLVEDQELLSLYLPIIRSDYLLYERYQPNNNLVSYPFGITVFVGLNDPLVKVEYTSEWKKYSRSTVKTYYFDSDHFFIHSEVELLIRRIENDLEMVRHDMVKVG